MAVFDNLNYSSSAGVQPSVIEQYYERTLLEDKEAELVNARDMVHVTLPKGHKRVQFRVFKDFEPITEPLKEGVTPNGQTIELTERTMTAKPYGRHVEVTDELDWKTIDNLHQMTAKKLRRQAMETLDGIAADAKSSGLNVIYVDATNGTNASRSDITAADKLDAAAIKRAVRQLEKNNAPRFPDGYYHATIDPDTKYDLLSDPTVEAIFKQQDKSKFEKYEVGTIWDVKFFETTATKKFKTESYLYDSVASVAIASAVAGATAKVKTLSVAVTTVSATSNTEDIAWYIRNMTNRMVAISTTVSSSAVLIPAYIDKIVQEGANLVHYLRFIGAASYTKASGDTIVPMPAGASGYVVHSTVIYGPEFCGDISLEGGGKNVSIIVKPAGSSGALDPLNQRGTIAWKVRGYGASILHENYGVRLEHGVTA